MATKKQTTTKQSTAKRSTAKSTAPRKNTAPRQTAAQRRAQETMQERQSAILKSVGLFAFGLLCIVMLFVPGMAAWAAMRTFFFGLFGISFYFVGVAILYFALLVAQQEPCLIKLCKVWLGMATLSGIAILFSHFELTNLTFPQVIAALYQNGAAHTDGVVLGGGLMGALFGGVLLALCGRPAANILVVILLLGVVMVLTGITPAEIADFLAQRFDSAKEQGSKAKESYLVSREQQVAARAAHLARAAQEGEARAREEEARLAAQPEIDIPLTEEEEEFSFDGVVHPIDETAADQQPWFKRFARQTKVVETQAEEQSKTPAAPRAFFDIDLGPAPSEIKTGISEPIEPIEIGPGGTFGLEAVRGVASVPLVDLPQTSNEPTPPEPDGFWQVPVEENDPVSAVEPQVAQPAPSSVAQFPVQQPAPVAGQFPTAATGGQDGWISMNDNPTASADGAAIEDLVAAAMDKPKLADAALVGEPVAEIITVPSYEYPPIDLFEQSTERRDPSAEAELKANAQKLVETLESFGVKTRVLDISRGPSVTRYELQPLAGVKISRITNLADDIALNLSVAGVRIEAPIPGKPAVGIEVPNRVSTSVAIRSILTSKNYVHTESPLTFALGKDIAGVAQVGDLCKMPHLLVAGSTGSGKSVCINSIIISFLFRASPEELKMILIDPKVVELAEYNGIPHLLMPVVTEPRKAAGALGSAVAEMEKRYRLFADNNVRDIKTYNKVAEGNPMMEKLPYIAIVIDELADLMMVSGKEVEDYICRIAQKARAAGMHLIVATQRPSVDVITGLIKANIPSRISFAVSSQIDSRTILDAGGAEKLLGMGDMLFMPVGAAKPVRIQGTYVKDEEISRVLSFLKAGGTAQYNEEMIAEMEKVAANQKGAAGAAGGGKADDSEGDPMLKQCAEVVIEAGQASTSLLQRRCKLGYARAARIMDEMEQLRIIGPYEGAKPRAVLVSRQQWIEMCMNEQEGGAEE